MHRDPRYQLALAKWDIKAGFHPRFALNFESSPTGGHYVGSACKRRDNFPGPFLLDSPVPAIVLTDLGVK